MNLTRKQREKVYLIYRRAIADGNVTPYTGSYTQFRRDNVSLGFGGEYVFVAYAGMQIGVERDGYSHT